MNFLLFSWYGTQMTIYSESCKDFDMNCCMRSYPVLRLLGVAAALALYIAAGVLTGYPGRLVPLGAVLASCFPGVSILSSTALWQGPLRYKCLSDDEAGKLYGSRSKDLSSTVLNNAHNVAGRSCGAAHALRSRVAKVDWVSAHHVSFLGSVAYCETSIAASQAC